MHVRDILKAKKDARVTTMRAGDSVMTAIDLLHQNRIGAVVVVDDDRHVTGMLSERDLVRGLAEHGRDALALKVSDLMTQDVYVCSPDDAVKETMAWITRHRVRHLPVVEDGALRGILSIGDVVKHRLEEVETEANVLRDIVTAGR